MGMKRFALGVGLGLAAGIFLTSSLRKDKLSPERALKLAIRTFAPNMNITGSWIHMIPETLEKDHLSYTVYRGGISSSNEDDMTQFEFLIDANTGTVLEVNET
jgi:predicted small secreted protein